MITHRKMKKEKKFGKEGRKHARRIYPKGYGHGHLVWPFFLIAFWDLVGLSFCGDRFGAARTDRQACALGV